MTEYMDKLVGKVVAKTKELGIYDNTYIIFCSGQRYTSNSKRQRCRKRRTRSSSHLWCRCKNKLEVLMNCQTSRILRLPCLKIAGIKPPKKIQHTGTSLLPFIKGEKATHREWIYSYTGPVQVFRTKTVFIRGPISLLRQTRRTFSIIQVMKRFGC